jgi:hypothetical protein
MKTVTLSGVVFHGYNLITKLSTNKETFTVRLEAGVVTMGLTSPNPDLQINVSGELTFKVAKLGSRTAVPKLTDLTSLESGHLKFSETRKDEITLKLPKNSAPSSGTFKYHIMKTTGAYSGLKGSGHVSFITLFPSDVLGDSHSNMFTGSLI